MTESVNHLQKFLCRALARQLSDNPNNSRHRLPLFAYDKTANSSVTDPKCKALMKATAGSYEPTILRGLEPVGGIERSVCRLLFGCSTFELHRLMNLYTAKVLFGGIKLVSIPIASNFQQLSVCGLRNSCGETPVQP